MLSGRFLLLHSAVSLSVGSLALGAQTIIDEQFTTDPTSRGWDNVNPSAGSGPALTNTWNPSGSYSGGSITTRADYWYVGGVSPDPNAFWHVSFLAKTATAGGYATIKEGNFNYNATGQWESHEAITRGDASLSTFFWATPGGVEIDNVKIEALNGPETAVALDRIWATRPALNFAAPADRFKNLEKTQSRLAAGQQVKIVMLGDSIVADTARQPFEPLVERMYPGSKLDVTASVRSSTGAWYYKEENRVQDYVLQYQPDLVMIGGISHQSDEASLRELIQQIRDQSSADILLTSPLASGADPYTNPGGLSAPDPTNASDWRNSLLSIAKDMNVGYWDMTQPWEQYILDSGLPYDSFLRDPIHMNPYGSMATARILESYFSPVPEPVSTGVLASAVMLLLARRRRPV